MSYETPSATARASRRLWRLAGLGLPPSPAGLAPIVSPALGVAATPRQGSPLGMAAEGATRPSAASLPLTA